MHGFEGLPVEARPNRVLRTKIINECGLARAFCHKEGMPVATDNARRSAGQFAGTPDRSGRVSVYLKTEGTDSPPASRRHAFELAAARGSLTINAAHATSGEPYPPPRPSGPDHSCAET